MAYQNRYQTPGTTPKGGTGYQGRPGPKPQGQPPRKPPKKQGGGGGKPNKGGGGGQKGGGNKAIKNLSMMSLFNLGQNLAHPAQQARRDMEMIYGPQIHDLNKSYGDYSNQMGSLYTVLGRQLGETGANAGQNYENVNNQYTQGTSDILGALGQSTAPDQQAYLNVLGNQALAGSNTLAHQAQNEARYNASQQDQAGMENTILQRNASGDLTDALNQLSKQRAVDFRSTLDQNRDTAFQRMLALKEFQLRAAQVKEQGAGDAALRNMWADIFGNAMMPNKNKKGKGKGKGNNQGQGQGGGNPGGPGRQPNSGGSGHGRRT